MSHYAELPVHKPSPRSVLVWRIIIGITVLTVYGMVIVELFDK